MHTMGRMLANWKQIKTHCNNLKGHSIILQISLIWKMFLKSVFLYALLLANAVNYILRAKWDMTCSIHVWRSLTSSVLFKSNYAPLSQLDWHTFLSGWDEAIRKNGTEGGRLSSFSQHLCPDSIGVGLCCSKLKWEELGDLIPNLLPHLVWQSYLLFDTETLNKITEENWLLWGLK